MTAVNNATTPPLPDPLDRRVWAVDPDRRWAEAALQDQLSGEWTYVQPRPALAGAARVSLKARPDDTAAQVTEALPAQPVRHGAPSPDERAVDLEGRESPWCGLS